ncbi:BA75_05179T0 [Komagataella pastoris]|uniref:BA75_05179T0 n=1 Tax=Komagataella pastoris TaxID=4922 RepID=A0A1B2JHM1_PICPA|nr:BA75_05179T0 [Komagataella pastoris]
MGSFIFSLAHFCETHGPTVVLNTQHIATDQHEKLISSNYDQQACESCKLQLPNGSSTLTSIDNEVTYVSTQYPTSQAKYSILRQVAIKCLSVESTSELSPVMFGDPILGFTLACIFKISDNTARGGERRYSVMIVAEDESELIHYWNIIATNFKEWIHCIKQKREQVLSKQAEQGNNEQFFRRTQLSNKNMVQLLEDPQFFIKMHVWASGVLKQLVN